MVEIDSPNPVSVAPDPSSIIHRPLAIAFLVISVACSIVPVIHSIVWRFTVPATTIQLMYHSNKFVDYPTAPFALLLAYLGICVAPRRSRAWTMGRSTFILAVGICVFLAQQFILAAVFCGVGLCFEMTIMPRFAQWRYAVPFFCIIAGWIGEPTIHEYPRLPSRVKSDMRSMSVAIENYHADHGLYPASTTDPARRAAWHSTSPLPTFMTYYPGGPYTLTTPVAYITGYNIDPMRYLTENRTFAYYAWGDEFYIIIGVGPNCAFDIDPTKLPETDLNASDPNAAFDRCPDR